jgi:ribonuclease HII
MALTKTKKRKRRPDHFRSKALSTRKISKDDFSIEQLIAFKNLLLFDQEIFENNASTENSLLIGFDEVGRGSIAGPVGTGAYTCSTFYIEPEELIQEIKLARQIISDQLLETNDRDSYYAETLCNDLNVADDINQLSSLSALLNLEDSKKVTKLKRQQLTEALSQVPCLDSNSHLFYSTNLESAKAIDNNGIVDSIWTSMTKNLVSIIDQYDLMNGYLPSEIVMLIDGAKEITSLEKRIKKLKKEEYLEINFKQIAIKKGDSKSSLIAAGANLAKLARDKHMTNIALDYNDYGWQTNAGYGTSRHYQAIEKFGITKEHRKSYLQNFEYN